MGETDIEKYLIAEDRHLVEWALEGDNIAFEFLITRYSESINRLFISRLRGDAAQEVNDLMQDTYIKVYINLHRYNKSYTFGQWIYTIARNTLIDCQRRRHEEFSIDERFASPPEEGSPNPEQSIINSQKRSEIERGITQLSKRQEELFRMRFIDEYTYEEISEKLSMPLGSVKTNIHRARAIMCRYIREHE